MWVPRLPKGILSQPFPYPIGHLTRIPFSPFSTSGSSTAKVSTLQVGHFWKLASLGLTKTSSGLQDPQNYWLH